MSNPVDVGVSVSASTQNVTAVAPGDYTAVTAAPVSFSAGSTTTQQVTVLVNRDNLFELDEIFQVLLSGLAASGRNVSLGTSTGLGTILNDDFASVVGRYAYHGGYAGVGSPVDTGKVLVQEGPAAVELGYNNLINTSRGINGLVFDIDGLPGSVSASDFVFQMSPTGAYNVGANPPAGWTNAPAPTSVGVTPGTPSRVLVQWPNSAIANRWLRVTVLANANTGLPSSQVYYLGHLLGETTGAVGGIFTVAFADITPIRSNVGQTVGANSIYDIDKSGTIAFADISAMRANVGAQLPTITIPASGGSELMSNDDSQGGSWRHNDWPLATEDLHAHGKSQHVQVKPSSSSMPLRTSGFRLSGVDVRRNASLDQLMSTEAIFEALDDESNLAVHLGSTSLSAVDQALEFLASEFLADE